MTSDRPLRLTASFRNYGHTAALKDGTVSIDGVELDLIEVEPQIAAFRRMVRDVEFDICELAPTTYVIAKAHGAPFTALPIFFGRRFHHAGLVVRPDAGIEGPKDLEGKKVGVRAYSVTTGVWTRGILQNEYGVDPAKVTWVVDDEEHVAQMPLPPNVVHAPEGKSLAGMMAAGELQAGFTANAGIGREGKPAAGWDAAPKADPGDYRELFPDAAALEAEWFARTGIYPVHSTLVIRDELLAAHPWLAQAVHDAFVRAKKLYLDRVASGQANGKADLKLAGLGKIVGDPLPYGLEANRPAIETLIGYAHQQALIPRDISIDELFVPVA